MRFSEITTHPRRGLFAIGAVLAVVLAGFLLGYARREMPLHEHARILHQAILEEDGATILQYVHPVERELNDLTPENTAAIVREMLNARYEAWEWTPESGVQSSDSGQFSAIAEQIGRIPGVGREPRGVQIWAYEALEGGRPLFLLSERISGMWARERVWQLRTQGGGITALTASDLAKAWASGFDRDERRLRELGLRYHTGVNFDAGVVRVISFENRRKVLQDWVASPDALFDPEAQEEDPRGHSRLWMSVDQAREHKRQASRETR